MAEANPRRDLSLLWTGQSISLFGDQFMVLCLGLSPQVADAWSRFCANAARLTDGSRSWRMR